jgi:hypothetical protein
MVGWNCIERRVRAEIAGIVHREGRERKVIERRFGDERHFSRRKALSGHVLILAARDTAHQAGRNQHHGGKHKPQKDALHWRGYLKWL